MLESAPTVDAATGHSFDVIVIGAGPAGLCCSLGLAGLWRAALIDDARFHDEGDVLQ